MLRPLQESHGLPKVAANSAASEPDFGHDDMDLRDQGGTVNMPKDNGRIIPPACSCVLRTICSTICRHGIFPP